MRGTGYLGAVALAFGLGDIVAAVRDPSCRSAAAYALEFNTTNVDALVHCMQYTHECPSLPGSNETEWLTLDNTNDKPPAKCIPANWTVGLKWGDFNGSFSIPKVVSPHVVSLTGGGCDIGTNENCKQSPPEMLNITNIELPDLVSLHDFNIRRMDVLEGLKVPKLEHAARMFLFFALTGPSINLDFPSLTSVDHFQMAGNIDSINLPVLNTTTKVIINSSGNLNCTAFVASIYNKTVASAISYSSATIICNSKSEGIATFRPLPKEPSAGRMLTVERWMVALGVAGSLSFGL